MRIKDYMGHITEGIRLRYRHADEESLRREAVRIKDDVNGARLY